MYQTHWGLSHSPFNNGLDRRRFFRSPTHDEALARLHFLVDEQRRLGLLLGGAGSGKSLVLEVFGHEVRRAGGDVLRLNLLGLAEHEFLWHLALAMGHNPTRSEPICQLWRAITDRLSQNRQQQLTTLLLLDDADEACPEVLEQVARLTQFDATRDARLTVVLAAAGHRLPRLGQRLLGLTELRIDIQSWEHEDTARYIEQALQAAGRRQAAFDDIALLRLHELSLGIPRRASQLADLSLLAAAGQGLHTIDEATVEAVCSELGIKEAYATQY